MSVLVTQVPMMTLQGVLSPKDARSAVDAGVDGLVLSNHGGRQLDHWYFLPCLTNCLLCPGQGTTPVLNYSALYLSFPLCLPCLEPCPSLALPVSRLLVTVVSLALADSKHSKKQNLA